MSKPTAFPLDESKLPFRIPKDQPFRENIAKLGQMITDRIPAKKGTLTQDDPEYWGLASIVTDEMAEVALKMKVRKPMTLPELVKATGKPADELEPLLHGHAPAEVVTMCGSGVTACHLLLALEVAGLHGARVYAGSWSGWLADPARPVATGA